MSARGRLTASAALATVAGATALGAAFASLAWLPPTAVAVALVAATLEACRQLRLPAVLGPPVALGVLLCFVTLTFAGRHAMLGVLPTGASLHDLANLARDGFHDIGDLAAPVPATRGLKLVTVVGIALLGLVVDLLAVVMRRPALAGLPLLAVYAVGSAVSPHGAGWLPFAVGALGFEVLLVADGRQRIARWGRSLGFDRSTAMVATWSVEGVQASPVSILARRVGAAALGVAVVVPALVPGLHGALGSRGGGGPGAGEGSSSITTFNPIVRIRDELHTSKPVPVLRMTSTDPDPDYVRMTSLDRFDGATWSASPITAGTRTRVSRGLPDVATVASTTTVHSHIKIETLDVHWLPMPYPPSAVKVKGDWRYDVLSGTVFSSRRSTRGLSYDVTSQRLQPTVQQLALAPERDRQLDAFTRLPPLPTAVLEEAARVTGTAASTFDKALALQRYFTSGRFTYDDTVSAGNGVDALTAFLFESRRGFCEQYAAAMAVMARAVGIPARVAVGFTRGTQQSDGSWLVTTHDAHAWPELRFSGIGWVRFEPTPAGGANGQAQAPSYARATTPTPGGEQGPGPNPTASARPGSNSLDNRLNQRDPDKGLPAPAPTGRRLQPALRTTGLAVVILLLLLVLPALTRQVVRRRRWRRAVDPVATAHAAWLQLEDDARDLGHSWRRSDTARTAAAALAAAIGGWPGEAAAAAARLVRAEERASFSAKGPGDVATLRGDVAVVRSALARSAGRGRRLRAGLFPASALLQLRGVGVRVADVLDRLEIGMSALRGRLTLRRRTA